MRSPLITARLAARGSARCMAWAWKARIKARRSSPGAVGFKPADGSVVARAGTGLLLSFMRQILRDGISFPKELLALGFRTWIVCTPCLGRHSLGPYRVAVEME